MIGRVIWVAMIAMIALVTVSVQLDRQARVSPALSASVPEPFRAFSQARLAASALASEDDDLALTEAEKLVQRRPVPAEHLRLLAAAQYKAGHGEAAAQTIQVAAKRGWRDPLSQEAVLRLAIAAGDLPEATRRYAALFLSNKTEDKVLLELGPEIFVDADGPARQTFTDIVSGGERWFGFFLNRGPRVLPADAFLEIVMESRKSGAVFPCNGINRAINILQNRAPDAAETLKSEFSGQC